MDGDSEKREATAGLLVQPSAWAAIRRDRLAFGLVVAKAFQLCGSLRVNGIGIVVDRALSGAEVERVRQQLDDVAREAFAAHGALRQLQLLSDSLDGEA